MPGIFSTTLLTRTSVMSFNLVKFASRLLALSRKRKFMPSVNTWVNAILTLPVTNGNTLINNPEKLPTHCVSCLLPSTLNARLIKKYCQLRLRYRNRSLLKNEKLSPCIRKELRKVTIAIFGFMGKFIQDALNFICIIRSADS